jgi:protease-4
MVRTLVVVLCSILTAFASFARGAETPVTVPVFQVNGVVNESPANEELPIFGPPPTSLKDLVERMEKAAKDPAIKSVVVLSENAGVGLGQVEELRQAMGDIRKAGKDVYVHDDNLSLIELALYSAASRISISPTGDLFLTGIHAEQPYLRGLLDKIGVEPDFTTCGEYKSAAEMFMRAGPSKPAEEMMNWLLDGLYGSWVNQVAAGRGVKPEKVREWVDIGLFSAEKGKAAGIIDAVEHRQDFEAMIRQKLGGDVKFDRKYGKPADKQLDLSSPLAAFKIWAEILSGGKQKKPHGPSVAIVYVEGPIVPGTKQPSLFGGSAATSSDIRKALTEATEDDSVKAVVLRVNSPGGSAVASEIILDATKRVKAKKPLVVSMGNMAGSGGYYVACGADTIFADETTLTGSIGVVAGKLVTTPMWNKIGITFQEYSRGKNADLLSTSHKFTPEQRQTLQSWMDEVYDVFKSHVKEIRGDRLKQPLDQIAGGRVYTGRQALEFGLVDQIGTMNDAIKHVAKKANVTDYEVRVIPEPKNFIEQLAESMGGDKSGNDAKHVSLDITSLALPYLQGLDPVRVSAIRSALVKLELLNSESVILAMPEVIVGQ